MTNNEKVEMMVKLENYDFDSLMIVARGLAQDDHDGKLTGDGQEILAYCAVLMSEKLRTEREKEHE